MPIRRLIPLACAALAGLVRLASPSAGAWSRSQLEQQRSPHQDLSLFTHSDNCVACHNNLIGTERRGRVDWRDVAVHDDGQLRARSVLASRRAPRDDRPSDAFGGHPERVRRLPHADGPEDRAGGGRQGRGLREPSHRERQSIRTASPRRRRHLLHGLSSDRARQPGHERQLQRQLQAAAHAGRWRARHLRTRTGSTPGGRRS